MRAHGAAIVIDPGDEADEILAPNLAPSSEAVAHPRHPHFDHLLAARTLQEATAATFYARPTGSLLAAIRPTCLAWLGYDPGDPPAVDGDLTPGEVQVGDLAPPSGIRPGHSPGGVTFVDPRTDARSRASALFAGSIGRTDLPGGSLATLLEGIRSEILSLPDDYAVLRATASRARWSTSGV